MESVELKFKYTQSEYVKAERQYLIASKTISKTSIIVLAVYLPFSCLYLFLSSFSALSIISIVVALLALILGCILYFYTPVHKFVATSKYHEEYSLTFWNDRINFKTQTIDSELKWSVYSELWESNDFYYLIQAPRMYTLIPKRTFHNHEAQKAFEEIALSNIKRIKRIL